MMHKKLNASQAKDPQSLDPASAAASAAAPDPAFAAAPSPSADPPSDVLFCLERTKSVGVTTFEHFKSELLQDKENVFQKNYFKDLHPTARYEDLLTASRAFQDDPVIGKLLTLLSYLNKLERDKRKDLFFSKSGYLNGEEVGKNSEHLIKFAEKIMDFARSILEEGCVESVKFYGSINLFFKGKYSAPYKEKYKNLFGFCEAWSEGLGRVESVKIKELFECISRLNLPLFIEFFCCYKINVINHTDKKFFSLLPQSWDRTVDSLKDNFEYHPVGEVVIHDSKVKAFKKIREISDANENKFRIDHNKGSDYELTKAEKKKNRVVVLYGDGHSNIDDKIFSNPLIKDGGFFLLDPLCEQLEKNHLTPMHVLSSVSCSLFFLQTLDNLIEEIKKMQYIDEDSFEIELKIVKFQKSFHEMVESLTQCHVISRNEQIRVLISYLKPVRAELCHPLMFLERPDGGASLGKQRMVPQFFHQETIEKIFESKDSVEKILEIVDYFFQKKTLQDPDQSMDVGFFVENVAQATQAKTVSKNSSQGAAVSKMKTFQGSDSYSVLCLEILQEKIKQANDEISSSSHEKRVLLSSAMRVYLMNFIETFLLYLETDHFKKTSAQAVRFKFEIWDLPGSDIKKIKQGSQRVSMEEKIKEDLKQKRNRLAHTLSYGIRGQFRTCLIPANVHQDEVSEISVRETIVSSQKALDLWARLKSKLQFEALKVAQIRPEEFMQIKEEFSLNKAFFKAAENKGLLPPKGKKKNLTN